MPWKGAQHVSSGAQKRWSLRMGGVVVALLLIAGAVVMYIGFAETGEVEDAKLPDAPITVGSDAPLRGDAGDATVDTNAGPMDAASMQPMHYFIPALGVYSEILPMDGFEPSRYSGFESLQLPGDPEKSAWFDPGGGLAFNEPGTEGTTMLASHVSGEGKWGVLKELYSLQGGELVYSADADGVLAAWKITDLYTKFHTDFPEEYWNSNGVRRLVLTTCGEYDPASGTYLQNIFAVAVPVGPVTKEPFKES